MADSNTSTKTDGVIAETVDTVTNHFGAAFVLFAAGVCIDRFVLLKGKQSAAATNSVFNV